jgi:hypothetical protein
VCLVIRSTVLITVCSVMRRHVFDDLETRDEVVVLAERHGDRPDRQEGPDVIAQPASSAVFGWKSSINRSAILPKKSSQNGLRS